MSDDRPPRSRFDRESPPPRSRFDRSRSPVSRTSESRRTRSPIAREASGSPATASAQPKINAADAAAAARAAAARINAALASKRAAPSVDVPPIRSPSVSTPPTLVKPSTPANPGSAQIGEAYQQDGDFIQDIEINDLRNRYTLTKGAIKDETGADVTTRGEYYPDKSMATAASPPLYLRVTSTSKEGLDAAVVAIKDMMQQDLPNLVDERRFRRQREPQEFEKDEFGRRKWPEEKIPVDLEPINGFNLRAQVVGRGGDNVKYIQQETGCKVQIKGRGSGFMEPQSGQESDEPMYLHIAGPRPEGVAQAKQLCDELLEKVKSDYNTFKERPPQQRFGNDGYSNGRGYGDRGYGDRYGDRGDRDRNHGYGQGGGYGGRSGYGGHQDLQSPVNTGVGGAQAATAAGYDANSWYYAQAGGADPYAAYGGYEGYVQWYNYYAAAAAQNSQAPGQTAAAAAPPPPPSDPAPGNAPPPPPPPPPPPSGSPPGGFNAVPPPPGM